ncbi:MAG: hypothetical protein RL637_1824 [Pseudomonadota bacterium]
MAIEIEHKFLLVNENWRSLVNHQVNYKQGYLTSEINNSIRIRTADQWAWINIKSATLGNQRQEYEYEIPIADAEEILTTLCHQPLIEKTRYFINDGWHIWEIDEFWGANQGLIIAEIELASQDESFIKPEWVGEEVTNEQKYYNHYLNYHPYSEWKKV